MSALTSNKQTHYILDFVDIFSIFTNTSDISYIVNSKIFLCFYLLHTYIIGFYNHSVRVTT